MVREPPQRGPFGRWAHTHPQSRDYALFGTKGKDSLLDAAHAYLDAQAEIEALCQEVDSSVSNGGRAESLRLLADYTATEIDANVATKLVEQTENYIRTVECVFG